MGLEMETWKRKEADAEWVMIHGVCSIIGTRLQAAKSPRAHEQEATDAKS